MNKVQLCPAQIVVAAFLVASQPFSAAAQRKPTFEEMVRRTDHIAALSNAEENIPELCRGYIGKIIRPATFDALSQGLGVEKKGEFETTASFETRRAAARRWTGGWEVLALPTDRAHVRYDADAGAMTIEAGAFGAREFSDEIGAQMAASLSAQDEGKKRGAPIPYSTTERPVRSYVAQNGFGARMQVTEIARHTRALYESETALFANATDRDSPVMVFGVPAVRARAAKATLRVALLLKPRPPYLVVTDLDRPQVTGPTDYIDKASVLHVSSACAFTLDGANRVLAVTGAGRGAPDAK